MNNSDLIRKFDFYFKDYIGFGKRSLVAFRKLPYQIINSEDYFYFFEIPGFIGDDMNLLDVNGIVNLGNNLNLFHIIKKRFKIKKSNIISVEIGGNIKDYFDLICGYITITVRGRFGNKKLTFELPGEVNRFVVKDFFGEVENIIIKTSKDEKIRSGLFVLDKNETIVLGALIKFFNKKGKIINAINWILSALSVILVFVGSSPNNEYGSLIKGIAAILPLIIYIIYIKYNGLLRFVSQRGKKFPYQKIRAECFVKITLPTIFILFSQTYELKYICEMTDYLLLSMSIAFLMVIFFMFTVKCWWHKYLLCICLGMCIFYSFVAVNAVNSIYVGEPIQTYNEEVTYKNVRQNSDGDDVYYYVLWVENKRKEYIVSKEEYDSLNYNEYNFKMTKEHRILSDTDIDISYWHKEPASTIKVNKYRGILGICYLKPEIGK